MKKLFINSVLIVMIFLSSLLAEGDESSVTDDVVTVVSFADTIISNMAALDKQADGINLKITPESKNLLESITDLLETDLQNTTKLSNNILANLDNEILMYKSNKSLVDKLLKYKALEESRLTNTYLKQQSKILSLKALNNVGTVLNLYAFKKSIDNIVQKVEYDKRLTKFDYMDVLSTLISFNPIGAVGSQLYEIEKDIDKAMDITTGINEAYKDSIWAIRDQYFNQYHILAQRGFAGKSKDNFIELFKKQRESLRNQLINLLDEIENSVILYGKDETIKVLSNAYDLISLDKESEIITKQENIYDKFYQYYLEKEKLTKEYKKIQDIDIFSGTLYLNDPINTSHQAENLKAKLFLGITLNETFNNGVLKGNIGDKVEIIFSSSGLNITDFVKEANDKGVGDTLKLWYYPEDSSTIKSITLEQNSSMSMDGFYSYYFNMQDAQMQFIKLTYNDPDRDGLVAFEFDNAYINYSINYKSIVRSIDTTISNPNATKIAKKIGNHLVSSTNIRATAFQTALYRDNKIYIVANDGIGVYDVSDKLHPKLIGNNYTGSNSYTTNAKLYYPYLYRERDNKTIIADISDPTNPIDINKTDEKFNMSVFYRGYAYGIDMSITSLADPKMPEMIGTMDINVTYSAKFGLKDDTLYATGAYKDEDNTYREIFEIVSLKNPIQPKHIASVEIGNYASRYKPLIYQDTAIILAREYNWKTGEAGDYGILIVDISDKYNPRLKEFKSIKYYPSNAKIYNGKLYVNGLENIYIYSLNNFNIEQIDKMFVGDLKSWDINDNYIYSAKIYPTSYRTTYKINIYDISNPNYNLDDIDILISPMYNNGSRVLVQKGNYLYVASNHSGFFKNDKKGFFVVDISDTSNIKKVKFVQTENTVYNIMATDNYLYEYFQDPWGDDSKTYTTIYDISNPGSPQKIKAFDKSITYADNDKAVIGGVLYSTEDFSKIADFESAVAINSKYMVDKRRLYDISDITNIKEMHNFYDGYRGDITHAEFLSNSILITAYQYSDRIYIYNISDPNNIKLITRLNGKKFYVKNNFIFTNHYSYGLYCYDITDVKKPKKILYRDFTHIEEIVDVDNSYLYFKTYQGYYKIDYKSMISKELIKKEYYYPNSNLSLISETYPDYSYAKETFTKTWTFDKDISDLDVQNIETSGIRSIGDFKKDGKTLSVDITPYYNSPITKVTLKFTEDGNPVKVNGSETFWSITRTNHPPRLADGQVTQLVSATNEPAFLEIETYDGDGDKVSLSIEDSAGGYVGFSKDDPNKIFASFNDGNTTHTIKIGLSDGKEKVIVPLQVLQFNNSSIEDFYSDVDKDSNDYPFDGIAFGTLEGVIWGQPDPNDPNKRIFRPKDDASMAEALAMIINAEKKAGLIQLASANEYMDVYPSWAMPYYTYARECGALDKHILNLADIYPTRENIAKIIVKTLGLDQQKLPFDVNATFGDSQDFSDASMLYYAKIAKTFGLFMLSENAKPKEHINRAELAQVIEKIFMIPKADLILEPSSADYGETFTYKLNNVKSKAINSSFELYDNIGGIKTYIITDGKSFDTKTIDNTNLAIGPNTIYAVLDNNGVKNITKAVYSVNFSDQDGDGVQDKDDKWMDDPRYAFDKNDNGIPDILDKIYKLDSYKVDDNVVIGDTSYSIVDIIKNGGIYTIEQKSISKIKKGWNLLSGDIDMDMLNNPDIQVAWSYKNGKWSAYSWNNQIMQEINDKEIQTLNELNETQGVWIKASKDLELNLKDTNITGYTLKEGWNLLGANRELNATYFSNSCAKYIWKYDNTLENSWRVYIFDDNISSSYPYSFDSIRKGEGFWLRCKKSDPSLLAFYKFDNGEYDNTKINDMSYSSHTLFVSGSWYSNDPYIKPHIVDSAYQWNDTYLELNSSKLSSNSFTDVNISDALTIMAYIKTDNENGNFPIISFVDTGTSDLSFGSSILGINLYYPSHSGWKFSLQVKNINGDTYQIFPSNEKSIEIGKFYHIAYVIYKNGDIKVYYNGVEGLGGHIDNLAIFQEGIANKKLIIGGGMGNGFIGGVDDIMIFNRALKPDEIKLYAKTIE